MNKKDLILNSLKYYDTNNEKYEKFFDRVRYYRLEKSSNELEHNRIIFYDKDRLEFYSSKYEILGCYFREIQLWVWGWLMGNKKNEIVVSKKLLNYGLDLGTEFDFLKAELITSRFRILTETLLDIHVSVASYISKNPLVFQFAHEAKSVVVNMNGYLVDEMNNYDQNVIRIYEVHRNSTTDMPELFFLYLLDDYKIDKSVEE